MQGCVWFYFALYGNRSHQRGKYAIARQKGEENQYASFDFVVKNDACVAQDSAEAEQGSVERVALEYDNDEEKDAELEENEELDLIPRESHFWNNYFSLSLLHPVVLVV